MSNVHLWVEVDETPSLLFQKKKRRVRFGICTRRVPNCIACAFRAFARGARLYGTTVGVEAGAAAAGAAMNLGVQSGFCGYEQASTFS